MHTFLEPKTMENLIIIILIIIFAIQTTPISLGLNASKPGVFHLTIRIFIIAIIQTLLLLLGIFLGHRFMFLLISSRKMVLFTGFFLLAIRFALEIFKIRKGERTYIINKDIDIVIPAIAIAINTFLAGILFYFVNTYQYIIIFYVFIFSLFFSIVFAFLPFSKRSFAIISLLYLMASVFLIIISFFFAFF